MQNYISDWISKFNNYFKNENTSQIISLLNNDSSSSFEQTYKNIMRREEIQKIISDNVRIKFQNESICKYWSEFIINHFMYRINRYRENFTLSFDNLKDTFNNLLELYSLYEQYDIFNPILKYCMRNLLFASYLADQELEKKKENASCIDACGRLLISFFSKFSNTDDKSVVFYCIICLTRIYFKLKTYRNSKTLVDWVEKNGVNIDYFPKSEVTTFYFYSGRLALYELKLKEANSILSNAFRICKENHFTNKKLILEYLITLKLFEGIIPTENILKKYQLMNYQGLITSFKDGNLNLFEKSIENLEDRLINLGTFLIIEKLKPYIMRNLIKSVYNCYSEEISKMKTPVIKLELIHNVLKNVYGYNNLNLEEFEMYLISVIFKGFINGYIHNVNKVIVFSKTNAFPKLQDVFDKNYNKLI